MSWLLCVNSSCIAVFQCRPSPPSRCAELWSRLGFEHLREEYLRYYENGRNDMAITLVDFYNAVAVLMERPEAVPLLQMLEALWSTIGFWEKMDFQRNFCAFRILDDRRYIML
ncbi:hypothetical protein COOONC_07262 [Cooperia oncophora]